MKNIDPKLYPQYNFRFDGIKDTYDKYYLGKTKEGNLVAVEKATNAIITEPLIIDRVKFSISWVNSVGLAVGIQNSDLDQNATEEEKSKLEWARHHYAFSEEARVAYSQIMNIVSKQLKTTGNIDALEIFENVDEYTNSIVQPIIIRLFNRQNYINAVDKWARHALPDALAPTQSILTLDEMKEIQQQMNSNSR